MIQLTLLMGAVFALLLGVFVLLNNHKAFLFRAFFVLTMSACLWLSVNALTIPGIITLHDGELLAINRLITPLSLFVSIALLYFFAIYKKHAREPIYFSAIVLCVLVSLFSFSSWNVYLSNNQLVLGKLFPFFLATIVYTNALSLFLLFKKDDSQLRSSFRRLQLFYLRLGFVIAILPAVGLGVFLPLFSTSSLSNLGPLCGVLFLVFVTIAIVRNRLFDVRFALARTMGYLVALVFIALSYGLCIFAISSLSVFGRQPMLLQRAEYVGLTLLTALFFPLVRKIFVSATDKIFYQDSYNPQIFLDELNRVIVGNIELRALLLACSQVIQDTLKIDYCVFYIKGRGDFERPRTFGATEKAVDEHIVSRGGEADNGQARLLVADYLPEEAEKLKRALYRDDIAALRPLISIEGGTDGRRRKLGYMVLGQKKSGNMYTSQDVRLLEIIANELVIAVQNSLRFEAIQRFNVTLKERIDDATRKLRRTNQRLKELDETKDDFISMASHQLRTPLTSIKGYLSLVLEGDAGKLNATQAKMLRQAFSSSQRMVFLITDLLNISRLKTGKFVIEPSPVDLSMLAQEEVEQLKEVAEIKQITLTYTKPAWFPKLMLDETKIRQVIMNFIDNAIYYTPVGGYIDVRLTEKPSTVELRVSDNGIGVPRSEQPHLFTKFYRATNARRARPDGTGLGLFMAKKAVTAQGGSIIFSSQEGRGSTFGFLFSKERLKVAEHAAIVPHSLTAQLDADVAANETKRVSAVHSVK